MNSPNKIALIAAILYTAFIGFGMYYMKNINLTTYGKPEMVNTLWWVEIVLTAITLYVVIKFFSWKEVGFRKINLKQLGWLLPSFLLLALMAYQFLLASASTPLDPAQKKLLALLAFTTFLVGFSEEIMYRGIVLHAFRAKQPILVAMLISAIAFSLLHAVNIFGGISLASVGGQLLLTFLFGFFFAPLMVKINNIWPLIIFHWLWDFILIGAPVVGADVSIGVASSLISLIFGSLLWFSVKREESGNAPASVD
ncbi:MAG: CPBP family intramembrane metalloprotease [Chloroflexi bacterium]|nr:CPBP family intramembrane metalloprotease [Chloroflexota bacterium]